MAKGFGGRVAFLSANKARPLGGAFPGYEERKSQHRSLDEIIGWFKDRPLDFEPGSLFSYSNSNYNLLATVVEKVSGETFGEFLRRNVLEPAGLRDTGHDGNPATLVPGRAA